MAAVPKEWRVDTLWGSLLCEQVRLNGRFYFRLAYGILREASGAEDVCQQAFSKAWERRSEIAGPGSLRPWLARVVINESLAVARRLKSERRAVIARRAVGAASSAGADGPMVEMRESVVAALEHLPDRTRNVVVLRLMQGMSGNDVGASLGCSAAEVSRQLHAGMELLRGHLAEWSAETRSE